MATMSRQKLIETILYFAQNTRFCGKLKLFKLLFLFDFEHYRQTGRSVTGLDYEAWEHGPVPRTLYDEWLCLGDDLGSAVTVAPEKLHNKTMEKVVAEREPDLSVLTTRERKIIDQLAVEHRDKYASEMEDLTHADGTPWHHIWRDGEGKNEHISYELSLLGLASEVISAIREHNDYLKYKHG